MPKHNKTLKQKILADKRLKAQNEFLYSFSPDSLKKQAKPPVVISRQTATIAVSSYDYLAKDLRKTAAFTGFIVLIELVLRFITK